MYWWQPRARGAAYLACLLPGLVVALLLALGGSLTPNQALAGWKAHIVNSGNNITTALLKPASELSAASVGRGVELDWSPGDGGDGYRIQGVALAAGDRCIETLAGFETVAVANGLATTHLRDLTHFTPQGTYFCYKAVTIAGGFSSISQNPTRSVRLGYVATSIRVVDQHQPGLLETGDRLVVTFNQPVSPDSGPITGVHTVCTTTHPPAILIGSTSASGPCRPDEELVVGSLRAEAGSRVIGKARYHASYNWSANYQTLTVTLTARIAGAAPHVVGDLTLYPTTSSTYLLSASDRLAICSSNAGNADCLPSTRTSGSGFSAGGPSAPQQLVLDSGSILAAWQPPPSGAVVGYHYLRGQEPDDYDVRVDVGRTLSYRDDQVQPGRTYYVRVVAYDGQGALGEPSPEASIALPLASPTPRASAVPLPATPSPIVLHVPSVLPADLVVVLPSTAGVSSPLPTATTVAMATPRVLSSAAAPTVAIATAPSATPVLALAGPQAPPSALSPAAIPSLAPSARQTVTPNTASTSTPATGPGPASTTLPAARVALSGGGSLGGAPGAAGVSPALTPRPQGSASATPRPASVRAMAVMDLPTVTTVPPPSILGLAGAATPGPTGVPASQLWASGSQPTSSSAFPGAINVPYASALQPTASTGAVASPGPVGALTPLPSVRSSNTPSQEVTRAPTQAALLPNAATATPTPPGRPSLVPRDSPGPAASASPGTGPGLPMAVGSDTSSAAPSTIPAPRSTGPAR